MIKLKKDYLILIIKLLILSLFIYSIVSGYIRITEFFYFGAEPNNRIQDYLFILTKTAHFRPTVILLIPIIGVFINNRIGWILIMTYFYFLISNLAFSMSFNESKGSTDTILFVVGFPLALLVIFLMNNKSVSNLFYEIPRKSLINMNIIATVIGLAITLTLAFI